MHIFFHEGVGQSHRNSSILGVGGSHSYLSYSEVMEKPCLSLQGPLLWTVELLQYPPIGISHSEDTDTAEVARE